MSDIFTFYDQSGLIVGSFTGSADEVDDNTPVGANVHSGYVDLESYRFINDLPVNKTEILYVIDKPVITADGIDKATISNLPDNTVATCMGEAIAPTLGEITFAVDLSGTYEIELTNPLYLSTIVVVTAS